ncbi:hypothetical protein RE428_49080 (plasmid) [Marinobacter nanhaiticus D15-8W]|nr:hypothetical protein RE428_49080 [Marinobacter nanhaiticus D15-8W]
MKRSRYTEEQIAFALKQAELGTPVPEVCQKTGVSDATFNTWRKKYGGLGLISGRVIANRHLRYLAVQTMGI